MLVAQRKELLLSRLGSSGRVVAKDLAEELGLSEDTIRRDLRELAAAGLCQRVYGGALPISAALVDYHARSDVEPTSKRRVARRAADLIVPGSTVILDGGTTTLAVVEALAPGLECTIVTHSPTIAVALLDHEQIEVILIGGRLFKHSAVTCGAAAAETLTRISADLFLLGVTGVHPVQGLTTGDVDEAAMKRQLASRAADTFVLASREKVGAGSRFEVLPMSAITGIVADAEPGNETLEAFAQAGVEVLLAG
jgi:DeoR/GlpR family transcriptional regulator of sugar metabolism